MPPKSRKPSHPAALLLGLLLIALPGAASAGTLTVIDNSDSAADTGSLRYAVSHAAAGDTINFAQPLAGGQTITVGSTLYITQPVTIAGPGAASLAIDGGHAVTVLTVSNTVGAVALSGLTIENGSGNFGGGCYNSGTLALTGCALTGNSARNGGGLYNDGTLTLTGCAITGNSTTGGGQGGGIESDGPLTMTDCTLSGNSAGFSGGGLLVGNTATLTDCLVVGNSAPVGGGIDNDGTLTLTGCTLSGNSAQAKGGGLDNYQGTLTLTDSVLYGDAAANGPEVYNNGGTVSATYSDIGQSGGYTDNGHNLDADPQFVRNPKTNGASDPGDLHLQAASPAIGAGVSVPGLTYDFDGVLRFAPPALGAYEYVSQTLVVTTAADSGSNSLRAAVASANATAHTLITFDPSVFATKKTITLTNGALNVTTPTAVLAPAAGVVLDGGHAVTLLEVSGGGLSAVGLTLQNGQASVPDPNTGSPSDDGGAVYVGGGADVALTDCLISGNSANYVGGGLYNYDGTLTLTGCTLTGNAAPFGGGLATFLGTAALTDDILWGDSAPNGPEAYNNNNTVSASFCDIAQALGGGGIVDGGHNQDADPVFYAPAEGDYRLASGSPLAGAGVALSGLTTDLDGRPRPDPPAVGAYEPVAGSLSATGRAFSAGAGQTLAHVVATFTDPNPSPTFPAVLIDWGDGTGTDATGTVTSTGGTGYAVTGTHAYAAPGQYTVRVIVHDGTGDALDVTGTANVATPPSAPTGLTATPAHSQVVLTWTASATPGVTYALSRGTSSGGENPTPIRADIKGLTFTDGTAAPGTPYYYTVKAVLGGYPTYPGGALGSGSVAGAASNEAGPVSAASAAPAAPTLTARAGNGVVTLKWTVPAGPVSGYTLTRGTDGTTYGVTLVNNQAVTSYTDTTATPGTTYYYALTANNSAGPSSPASTATATVLGAPSGLAAVRVAPGKVKLTWAAPAVVPAGTTYALYRGTTPGGESATPFRAKIGGLTYTDAYAPSGQTVYYTVRAVSGAQTSAASGEANAGP